MANQVIKKDGSKELFEEEKIKQSIRAAAQEAGLEAAQQEDLAEKVITSIKEELVEREEITSLELRDKILGELDLLAPEVSASWRDYELSKEK